jgi:hypothetical protein
MLLTFIWYAVVAVSFYGNACWSHMAKTSGYHVFSNNELLLLMAIQDTGRMGRILYLYVKRHPEQVNQRHYMVHVSY